MRMGSWLLLLLSLMTLSTLVATAQGAECDPGGSEKVPPTAPPDIVCPLADRRTGSLLPMGSIARLRCQSSEPEPCWVCDTLRRQLACGGTCAHSSAHAPAGESVFLRRSVSLRLTEPVHRAIVAARISQSASFALEVTSAARRSPDAVERFAAAISAAYVLLKADASTHRQGILDLVSQLRQDEPAIGFSTADVDFIEATVAARDGAAARALKLLDAAVAKEADFFAALALAASLQLGETREALRQSATRCQAAHGRLFRYLARLMDTRPCPRQAVHVEVFLARQMREPQKDPVLAAAQVYLAVLARQPDRARSALERVRSATDHRCHQLVVDQLEKAIGVPGRAGRRP